MAPRTEDSIAKPKNDAYTGMLAISFLALTVSCVLLYLEYDSYGSTNPPPSPNIDVPGIKLPSAIPAPIAVKKEEPIAEPKKEEPKDGEPAKDAPVKDKDAMPKDAPAAKDVPAKDAPVKDAPAKDKDAMPKDANEKTSLLPPLRLPDVPAIRLTDIAPTIVPVKVEGAIPGELPPLPSIVLPPDLKLAPADLPPIDLKPFVPPK